MSFIALNRNKRQTVYHQIESIMRQEIMSSMKPGDILPPEHELAARFAVNRHTVRRAVEALISDGIVDRVHGKGTFVLETPLDYSLHHGSRFTETFESMGMTTDCKVIDSLIIPARGGVASRLNLRENEDVIWIETVRKVDGRPVSVVSHFLPYTLFPDLIDQYHEGSLHSLLHDKYGIKLRRMNSLINAILPQGNDATLLSMPRTQPVLRVKSLNVNNETLVPVEYALSRMCADRIRLSIDF